MDSNGNFATANLNRTCGFFARTAPSTSANLSPVSTDSFTEASQMLASALEQIDDIIAGAKMDQRGVAATWTNAGTTNGYAAEEEDSGEASSGEQLTVHDSNPIRLARRLAEALQLGNGQQLPAPPSDTSPSPSTSTVSCPEYDIHDKLQYLEREKESLSLQVTVLSEQVGAQTEKIKDLESLLEDKRQKLDSTEEMLQEELVSRTTLETGKLDLMAEISNLKIKFVSIEKDKMETEHKLRSAQVEISHLQRMVQDRNSEIAQFRNSVRGGSLDAASEIEQLKAAVQQLVVANTDKDRRIQELSKILLQQQNRATNYQGGLDDSGAFSLQRSKSNTSSIQAHGDINEQLRQLLLDEPQPSLGHMSASSSYADSFVYPQQQRAPTQSTSSHSHLSMPSSSSYTSGMSSGLSNLQTPPPPQVSAQGAHMAHLAAAGTWSMPGTPRRVSTTALGRQPASPQAQLLAAELQQVAGTLRKNPPYYPQNKPPKSPSSSRRDRVNGSTSGSDTGRQQHQTNGSRKGLKWLLKRPLKPNKRSTSAPNLGDNPMLQAAPRAGLVTSTTSESESDTHSARLSEQFRSRDKKQLSLRRLIGKMRRSNSQELDPDLGNGAFQRGTMARATAGPRLGWSMEFSHKQHVPLRPSFETFCQWDTETIADWLTELGLNMYVGDSRRSIRSGRHLLNCTQTELERELGIKNGLHRKKLMLALRAVEQNRSELAPADRMDYHQVLRWLDDIGLPQYRDAFAENRVDGAMLTQLTVDDLLQMKITSALHHATLARGIQILRTLSYNLSRFVRKYVPETASIPCPNQVQMWTQHCVSEWLRSVDLAEFTPNLMCAGIHGALMVLEPLFTAESLCTVLQIPAHKTLLRRHLSTHFNELLGPDVIALKREVLAQPFMQQLTPGLKIRPLKKGFSLTRRKASRGDMFAEPDELICPLSPTRRLSEDAPRFEDGAGEMLAEPLAELSLHNIPASNV